MMQTRTESAEQLAPTAKKSYPMRERRYLFWLLTAVGGFFGAYTYAVRGGIFCNAQTANIVLLSMALVRMEWKTVGRLLVSITAYFVGILLSEALGRLKKTPSRISFSTVLVSFEALAVIVLALLPSDIPHFWAQISLSFITSMQFNTFRQNEGIPMATTFVTAHVRETGANLAHAVIERDKKARHRFLMHGAMLAAFILGAVVSTLLSDIFGTYALLGALPLLLTAFALLLADDLKTANRSDPNTAS